MSVCDPTVVTKTCRDCGVVKPFTDFSPMQRGSTSPLNRKSYCRECVRVRNAVSRERTERRRATALCPVDAEPRVWLPPGPLVAAMLRHAGRIASEHDEPETRVCHLCNIDPRRLYAWKSGETKRVELDHADKVLIGLGLLWWEVWEPAVFPEVAAIFEPVEQVAA